MATTMLRVSSMSSLLLCSLDAHSTTICSTCWPLLSTRVALNPAKQSHEPLSRVFARYAATARRTTKMLRTQPAPSAATATKYAMPVTNHIVFNPPPSAPSPYQTPFLFLPLEDPRRALLAPSHMHEDTYAALQSSPSLRHAPNQNSATSIPQPLSLPRKKTYHLTTNEITEIRTLRASDPWTWTRARLAKRFGCTELFISMCAPAGDKRIEWAQRSLERVKQRWGPRRRRAREERTKRRDYWSRDE